MSKKKAPIFFNPLLPTIPSCNHEASSSNITIVHETMRKTFGDCFVDYLYAKKELEIARENLKIATKHSKPTHEINPPRLLN